MQEQLSSTRSSFNSPSVADLSVIQPIDFHFGRKSNTPPPPANLKTKIWLTWIPTDLTLKNGIVVLIDNLQGYCSIYNELGQFVGNLELNEFII